MSGKVEGIALVPVKGCPQAEALKDAVSGPQHGKDGKCEESLL